MQITQFDQIKREGYLYIVFAHGHQHSSTTAWTQEREATAAYKAAVQNGYDATLYQLRLWEPRKLHRWLTGKTLTLRRGTACLSPWGLEPLKDSRMVEHKEMHGLANFPTTVHITLD